MAFYYSLRSSKQLIFNLEKELKLSQELNRGLKLVAQRPYRNLVTPEIKIIFKDEPIKFGYRTDWVSRLVTDYQVSTSFLEKYSLIGNETEIFKAKYNFFLQDLFEKKRNEQEVGEQELRRQKLGKQEKGFNLFKKGLKDIIGDEFPEIEIVDANYFSTERPINYPRIGLFGFFTLLGLGNIDGPVEKVVLIYQAMERNMKENKDLRKEWKILKQKGLHFY